MRLKDVILRASWVQQSSLRRNLGASKVVAEQAREGKVAAIELVEMTPSAHMCVAAEVPAVACRGSADAAAGQRQIQARHTVPVW